MPAPVYLDYQATAPLDPRVLDAMLPWMRGPHGNPHSSEHAFGWRAHEAISAARDVIAASIGAEASEIVFTSGATEANNMVLRSFSAIQNGRDIIVLSAIEHPSVLEAAHAASANGMRVLSCPVDEHGAIVIDELITLLSDRVALVSCCAVNNEIGVIQNIAPIAEAVHGVGAYLHTDCSQAPLSMPIDVSRLGVDFATFSAHKIHGPTGIGALYANTGSTARLSPLLFGGGQQNGLRAGTLSAPLCVGFAEAFRLVSLGGELERARIRSLRDRLLERLTTNVPGTRLVGSLEARHPGNLSLLFPVHDARDVIQRVQPHIAIATGSACHSGTETASHVLRALGLEERDARRVARIGVGRFTTDEEIYSAVELIAAAIRDLQAIGADAMRVAL